jgi:hypothetical protein
VDTHLTATAVLLPMQVCMPERWRIGRISGGLAAKKLSRFFIIIIIIIFHIYYVYAICTLSDILPNHAYISFAISLLALLNSCNGGAT